MLRVPARWRCASSQVALVQVSEEESVALCTVVPSQGEASSWELDASITITPQYAATLTAQDFFPVETHNVYFLNGTSKTKRRFVEAPVNASDKVYTLRIQTPRYTYTAKTVILEGPRVSLRGTLDRLFANLIGCYIIVNCDMEMDGGRYHVNSVELQSGYRGLALVSSTTRVKLNHKNVISTHDPGILMGVSKQIDQFRTLLQTMENRPGNWIGVSLYSPEGCGALELIDHCVNESQATLVNWSPTTIWERKEKLWGARLVVLCVSAMDILFPSSEESFSKLTLRTLLRDINRLIEEHNGVKSAVVLVGITSTRTSEVVSSLFSTKITIELPDVHMRAALLSHVRGGDKEDYMNEAHTLVGYSSTAVLEIARNPPRTYKPPIKTLHWSEIGGLEDVKNRLRRALILPRLQPEAFIRFGVEPPRGILLYGPPGCAKTSLVKALCSEGYFAFIYLDSATLISAYVGESERLLRDVFQKAAQQKPCIVFFDEVEVLGGKRGLGSRDGDHARLLSTLLTEMDGFASSSGVCFVGATNTPHFLDSALLRPGRFDYLVYVPLPTRDDRYQILQLALKGTSADINILADVTEGFSGADLSSLSSQALLEILEQAEESSVPTCLHDSATLTDLFLTRIKTFHKTTYDVKALEEFHKDCSSFSSSM
ncbi:putative Transitional endoplasmic reticulum ATPase [Trypanosoma theileri]|uniref:Putative Transitional endoplasmic reticulum ATPase n=1 Tax=Trypanosoma theileri TaxID=67003 RepID=A0A1X0P3W8_9TRYP|nr:putative Transitional endoplasmic reticulum ATPase [Trypanosoma theileri]ORC91616.1 putative Transitional endoplasmic reticulum ATPase [Trypanosoma theileri]